MFRDGVLIFKKSLYLPRNTMFRLSSGLSQEDQFIILEKGHLMAEMSCSLANKVIF